MDRSTRIVGKPKGPLQRRAALIAWVTLLTVAVVLDAVWLIDDRASPNYPLVVGAGLAAGVAMGMLLAYVWDRHAGRLTRVSDVEAATGRPVLRVIPAMRLEGADRVAVSANQPVEGQRAYGVLAAGLADTLRQSGANCVLITSPTRGAGRTTTAVNLATLLAAEEGLRVALLSADPNGEGVDEMLGLQRQPGLTELLDGSSSLNSALQPGGVDRLSVLTAGGPSDEALGKSIDELARLLDRLTKSVDLIVIDAPPVLGGPEVVLMAQDVDLVLLVVDKRRGQRADASLAVTYLGHVQDRLVGCVANDPGPRRSRRPRTVPAPAPDPAASPSVPVGRVATATAAGPWLRRGIGGAASAVGAVEGSVRGGARAVRGRVASAASPRALKRLPWAGVIATAVAVAMVFSTVWWLTYDGSTEAQDRPEAPDTSLVTTAWSSQAAVVAATEECRSTWDAQTAPLEAAAKSLQQWQVHFDAMSRLVAGKITLAQANAFWARTRVQAAQKVHRFHTADRAYTADRPACRTPDVARTANADLTALTACQHKVAQRDDTLGAARAAIDSWHHHVMDMNMLRAGTPSPARAVRLWSKSRRQGMAELGDYRSQLRQTDNRNC